MSLNGQEIAEMVRLHIEKAHQNLSDAQLLFESESLSSATGRLYYAVFHAVHALFVANGISSKTHHCMNTQFNEHFIKTGKIEVKYGRVVANLEYLREKAEYDIIFRISRDEYEALQPVACELIQKIESLLDSDNK